MTIDERPIHRRQAASVRIIRAVQSAARAGRPFQAVWLDLSAKWPSLRRHPAIKRRLAGYHSGIEQ